ncbi:MAG TPA: RIP metalloprotease RseP, partial [Syntrophorhabdaceae bacterium]|nr:RIP metalloprotease RseP [Syntrophorhabdaceae bacterium]
WKKGETEYAISAMPLGGYVKLLGESPEEEVSAEEQERSFTNKTPFQRFLIVFAGPFFNLIFALAIIYVSIIFNGYGLLPPRVENVIQGYPAYTAGLKAGDTILEIDGAKINKWSDLMQEIAFAGDGPMKFVVQRGNEVFTATITPVLVDEKSELGNITKRKKIGVEGPREPVWKRENPFSAVPRSIQITYSMTANMLRGIYHMISGNISTKEIGGPIAILQLTGKQAKNGVWSLATFVAFISINLGILNLLPIPVLDGGHILFNFIEFVTRRRVSDRTINISQKIGLTLLIMLMAFAFYNDIQRLFETNTYLQKIVGFFSSKPAH